MIIPNDLRQTVERVQGAQGRTWLAVRPALLLEFRQRWALELEQAFENLSYNFVVAGRTAQGAAIVLKLGVPCRELWTEAAALELFAGNGAVRLLNQEAACGVLLLERALPGLPLGDLRDEAEATRVAATLIRPQSSGAPWPGSRRSDQPASSATRAAAVAR